MKEAIPKEYAGHRKYRQSVLFRTLKKDLDINGQDEIIERIINKTGVSVAFNTRKNILAFDRTLKESVKEVLNEIRLSKSRCKELFVYPSEVEKGKKTIREYCKYVDERTDLVSNRTLLKTLEYVRRDLQSIIEERDYFWWTRPKQKQAN